MNVAILALLVIMLISTVCGWWMIRRKDQEKPVKIMMFVGYFWLLTFLQLFLFALLYFIGQRFLTNDHEAFASPQPMKVASQGAVACWTERREYVRVGSVAASLPPTPVQQATALPIFYFHNKIL